MTMTMPIQEQCQGDSSIAPPMASQHQHQQQQQHHQKQLMQTMANNQQQLAETATELKMKTKANGFEWPVKQCLQYP